MRLGQRAGRMRFTRADEEAEHHAAEEADHLIGPDELLRVAIARQ